MHTSIYWFSGSGNSLATAKRLAGALAEAERRPIAAGAPPPHPCAHLILVFPVYAFGLPRIVARFIDKLPRGVAPRATVVATHGGFPGPAPKQAADLLAAKGVEAVAAYTVKLVDSFPSLGGPPAAEKCRELEQAGARRMQALARRIAAGDPAPPPRPLLPVRWFGHGLHRLFYRFLPRCERKFHATAACTSGGSCGRCVRVCPAANLVLTEGRPVWQGRCELCFSCYHTCPEQAIHYGRSKKQTRPYLHPEVAVDELLDRCAPFVPGGETASARARTEPKGGPCAS